MDSPSLEPPASFRADEEIVRAAVGQAPRALKYASDELRANRELVLECVKREGLALHGASAELGTDPEVVEAAMAQIAEAALKAEAEEEEELRQCPVAPFYPRARTTRPINGGRSGCRPTPRSSCRPRSRGTCTGRSLLLPPPPRTDHLTPLWATACIVGRPRAGGARETLPRGDP